jgi:dephospho-CoA kinase
MNAANNRLATLGGISPLRVGVTGGIGSGKSVVCRIFACLGIPIFNADDAAKYVLTTNAEIRQQVNDILGEDVYLRGGTDTARIGQIIFSDADKRRQLEALLQPLAIAAGNHWMGVQTSPYVIKEAAIFFETGSEKYVDVMVGVSAPADMRIARAMQRNNASRERIEKIIAVQMDDAEKMSRCQYVIINDNTQPLLPQVLSVHKQLILL